MKPGEKQFWRVSSSASDTIINLQLQFVGGVPQTLQLVELDGVPTGSRDSGTSRDRASWSPDQYPDSSRRPRRNSS